MAENSEIERVLVTGATGYIAAHLIQQLQQAGYAVRGTVRSLGNEARLKHLKDLCPDAAHELELVEADLQKEESWTSAVDGCTYVLHTASPFPLLIPSDENRVIKPAVEGVTNVLKAVAANGKVKRVVMTSAGLAICGDLSNNEFSEKDWPKDVDGLAPYPKSKTLAEKAAWDFVEGLAEGEKFEFVVVHPVGVVGPILSANESTSTEIIKRLLKRTFPPRVPKVNLPLVDVRDVAAGHIAAMECPEAAGNRHILYGGNMWWGEIASILREEFKPQGYKVPTKPAPKFIMTLGAKFDRDAKLICKIWNKECKFDNRRMREVLKIEPRDVKTAVIEMGYSLIEAGIVKKTSKYRGADGGQTGVAAGGDAEGETPAPTSNGPTSDEEAQVQETKSEEKTEDKTEESKPDGSGSEEAAAPTTAPATEAGGASKPGDQAENAQETPAEETPPPVAPAEEGKGDTGGKVEESKSPEPTAQGDSAAVKSEAPSAGDSEPAASAQEGADEAK